MKTDSLDVVLTRGENGTFRVDLRIPKEKQESRELFVPDPDWIPYRPAASVMLLRHSWQAPSLSDAFRQLEEECRWHFEEKV